MFFRFKTGSYAVCPFERVYLVRYKHQDTWARWLSALALARLKGRWRIEWYHSSAGSPHEALALRDEHGDIRWWLTPIVRRRHLLGWELTGATGSLFGTLTGASYGGQLATRHYLDEPAEFEELLSWLVS